MDPIKPEARGVVAALHHMGLQCLLLTGDCWRTARAIAEQLGISSVVAEVLPAGKVSKIKASPRLQAKALLLKFPWRCLWLQTSCQCYCLATSPAASAAVPVAVLLLRAAAAVPLLDFLPSCAALQPAPRGALGE